jgi:hypothetical protein
VTLAELVRDIAYHNPVWTPSDVEQRARLLREGGLLPHGGRGRPSPPVIPRDVATLLLGLSATGRAVEVVPVVKVYRDLQSSSNNGFARAPDFATALTVILEDTEFLRMVDRVEICRSWPEAVIVYRKGKKSKTRVETYLPHHGRPARRDQIQVSVNLRTEMLLRLSSSISS